MVVALLPFRRNIAGDLFVHNFLCFKDKYLWAIDDDIPPGRDLKDWINEQVEEDGLTISYAIKWKISAENTLILAEVDSESKKFMYEGHMPDSYDDDVVWFQFIDIQYPIEGDPRRVINPNWLEYYSKLYNNRTGFSSYFVKDAFRFKEDSIHLQYILMILAEDYRTRMMPEFHTITRKMKGMKL